MDVELQMLDDIFALIYLIPHEFSIHDIFWTLKAYLKSALFESDFGIKEGNKGTSHFTREF